LFQNLPAVKHGTVCYADLAVADAANVPAPMALRWLKDKLAPTIRALG
jgi:iron complex transport system substrate-binding protein